MNIRNVQLSANKIKLLIFVLLFILHLFLRFYELESRSSFTWDQVKVAWESKNILVDHKLPLLGYQARLNSGIFIGPGYYYLIAPFYFFTNLDPIASPIFAGIVSIVTFFTIFYVTKQLFSFNMALITVFINTTSYHVINYDRVEWLPSFIVPVSFLIFYALYKVLTGNIKFLLLLGLVLGFSFHVHFTSIFYPLIILLSLPFFPRTKAAIKYGLIGFFLLFVWLIPSLLSEITTKVSVSGSVLSYVSSYYHGVHLVRFFQLTHDAFIEFGAILFIKELQYIKFLFLPLFCLLYLFHRKRANFISALPNIPPAKFIMCYLALLWIFIPWAVFTVYSGEITNYYFFSTRPIALIVFAYLSYRLFMIKNVISKVAVCIFFSWFAFVNIQHFLQMDTPLSLEYYKQDIKKEISNGKHIPFTEGDPSSYLYYVYTRK